MTVRAGNAALLLVLLAVIGGGYYALEAGYISAPSAAASSTIPGVSVYWADGGEPPSCVTDSGTIRISAIARDQERRFDEAGVLGFQWRSSSGWEDFKRTPTSCAQQVDDFFCTVSTTYGMTAETLVDGELRVRAKLTMGNGTATSGVKATRLATDGAC